jgi:hypothetical protein
VFSQNTITNLTTISHLEDKMENEVNALSQLLLTHAIDYQLDINIFLSKLKLSPQLLKIYINELIKFVTEYPKVMKSYSELIKKIKELETLPNSKKVPRQLLLLEIDKSIESIYSEIVNQTLLRLEFLSLSKTVTLQMNADLKWLERYALFYFSDLFKPLNKIITKTSFYTKLDGDQLGRRLRIEYNENGMAKEIFYFIKTHQEGSRRNGSSSIAVDPKEIFIYKLLELTHYGPKVHFFLNPLAIGGFYIATQDEGFTKTSHKLKLFNTYGQLRDAREEKLENNSLKLNEDKSLQKAILTAHLFQRIFHLWDIITNPGNYGRTSIKNNDSVHYKWRIIDFRVSTSTQYLDDKIADNFIAGQDMEGYIGQLQSCTKNLTEQQRIESALIILEEFSLGRLSYNSQTRKLPIIDAINQAFIFTARLLKAYENIDSLGFALEKPLGNLANNDFSKLTDQQILEKMNQLSLSDSGDLGLYMKSAIENFKLFSEKLKNNYALSLKSLSV